MRNVWIILRKELRSYFSSPIAYLLLTMFAAVFGVFFWLILDSFVRTAMASQMRGQMYPMNINEQVIGPLLHNVAVICNLFLIPLISMRLFAEEKRTGTIELLATSPIRDIEVILGKWLAAMALYGCMILVSALSFVFLFKYGNPDWKPIVVAYLGLYLQAGALLAIGIFISTLTRNQIIAGAVTFGACILLWIAGWVEYQGAGWARVVSYICVLTHYESFVKGLISSKDVVYYVTVIVFGLFLTARSMESLRWRS